MTVRHVYNAIQRGDLTVLPDLVDILGEVADAIDMLHDANPYERIEILEHLRDLDHTNYAAPAVTLDWGTPNPWF